MPDVSRLAGGDIRFRVGDGAAILGLNRPAKRNAVSQPMWEAIREALAEAAADPEVRAFVIEGLPGTFCAGADLAAVKNADREAAGRYREIAQAAYGAIREFPRPTVAVIDGLCKSGGCNIAMACDIRLAGRRPASPSPPYGTGSCTTGRP